MLISDEHLDEFIALIKKDTGKTMNRQEALESATKLIRLVEIVYKYKYDEQQKQNRQK